jgi:hypothetical protein
VGLERGPLSLVSTTEELLGRKSSGPRIENKKYGLRGSVRDTPLSVQVGDNFADKRRSLGRYSSFVDSGHGEYILGRTPWRVDQPVARPLPTHGSTQAQNKCTQTSMPPVGFEPRISVGAGEDSPCLRPRAHCDRLMYLCRVEFTRLGAVACRHGTRSWSSSSLRAHPSLAICHISPASHRFLISSRTSSFHLLSPASSAPNRAPSQWLAC